MKGRGIMFYGSIAGALMAIIAFGGYVASSPYRPALYSEVIEVGGLAVKNRSEFLFFQIGQTETKLLQARIDLDAAKQRFDNLTPYVTLVRQYEQELERLRRELKELEN